MVTSPVCAKLLQSCRTLHDPMNCSPPGSSVCEILLARIMGWIATPSSRRSSWPRDWAHVFCVFCIGIKWFFTTCTTWEAQSLLVYIFWYIEFESHTGGSFKIIWNPGPLIILIWLWLTPPQICPLTSVLKINMQNLSPVWSSGQRGKTVLCFLLYWGSLSCRVSESWWC